MRMRFESNRYEKSYRNFFTCNLLLVSAIFCNVFVENFAASRPHIVFIMVDDVVSARMFYSILTFLTFSHMQKLIFDSFFKFECVVKGTITEIYCFNSTSTFSYRYT